MPFYTFDSVLEPNEYEESITQLAYVHSSGATVLKRVNKTEPRGESEHGTSADTFTSRMGKVVTSVVGRFLNMCRYGSLVSWIYHPKCPRETHNRTEGRNLQRRFLLPTWLGLYPYVNNFCNF